MKIYNCIKDFKPVPNPVVTIGTFDGVHLGHQAVFDQMKREAKKIKGETVVITFFPHPRIVLGLNSKNLKFINTQEKKINRIEAAGIDHLVIVSFTKQFAGLSSEDFLRDLVIGKIKPAKVIIGYDHHFGKNREGSFELLLKMGNDFGFEVDEVEARLAGGTTVSSTKIRKLLEAGEVCQANELLGYEYSITGKVVKGKSIGRKLGFPTANIEIADEYKLIAADGVYACRVYWMGNAYKGMSNIGFRPTIDHGELTIEVNIFDFNQTIYGEEITISFVERMRDEKKFESLEALTAQLVKDKKAALELL
ncbi:MAG: bifunctional riboflavin kinase/FAD synthetase [Bacteroidales bacterium]|nr:bifunctional riboflavin kinase/FAD synthetase [Bacteroidales bacterium]